jgi:5'-nucleotidase
MFRSAEVNTIDLTSVTTPSIASGWRKDQVRIVFDGDGVLFSDEAETIYRTKGLEAFRQFEQEKEHIELPEGPMHTFAFKLQKVREALGKDNTWRIRTFLVTARNGVANERPFKTLKKWGLDIDETHFLGGLDKTPFLRAIDPAIFFDDSREHVDRAKQYVPTAHVVYGVQNTPPINLITDITILPPSKQMKKKRKHVKRL